MLKNWWRKFRKSDALRQAGCYVGSIYIRLIWATGRWEIRNSAAAELCWKNQEPFIIAFWHGRMLVLPAMWPTTAKMHMLISMHRDGELIARAIGHFGHGTVRGSAAKPGSTKDKGGAAALRGMLKALKAREYVGITPDGPRGPRMRATDGIVTVARVAGVPIIPCSYSAKSRVVLGTWDRFIIPLPFTRGVIIWGDPIRVPRDADAAGLAVARQAVEDGLNRVCTEADVIMGVETVEPAPLPVQQGAPA
jgi:lysophospholipid acyltransferase (LPLAT)-like uncharacterized protein